MRKDNKDYKPRDQYEASQDQQRNIAHHIATQIHAITARTHIDIQQVIYALTDDLLTTMQAARKLGLSSRAFLRLRRKYGLQPVFKEWVSRQAHQRRYNYTVEQLSRIPVEEVELSKRRSAMALQPRRIRKERLIGSGLDLRRLQQLTN